MKKQLNGEEIDFPLLSSLNVTYIHETREFIDIYRKSHGKYQQILFKVKRHRGRLARNNEVER